MTKWIISSFSFLIFATVLFINLQNNSEINDEFNTNLANVTNEEILDGKMSQKLQAPSHKGFSNMQR